MAGALIVTAELGPADFAWLDAQRRAHFPPERNHLGAHLTLFHALPPSVEGEVRTLLADLARAAPPAARITGLMNLGRGTAWRVESEALAALRAIIAERFHGLLTAQDAGFRAHVTIQNKVAPEEARALQRQLAQEALPGPLAIAGLGLHRYLGGPWEKLGVFPFRGAARGRQVR